MVVNASDTATLSCNFDGNPIPTVTWYKNDLKIDSKNGDLKLENVDQMATGEYKCEGRSELGRAESQVQLVVRGPPIITSESGIMSQKSHYWLFSNVFYLIIICSINPYGPL